MAPTEDLEAEARDRDTAPERLAQIAHEQPSLRSLIALNPSAYNGLLEWLEKNGDRATRDALEQRRHNLGQTPPPPPPPPPPSTETATERTHASVEANSRAGAPSKSSDAVPRKQRSRAALFGISGGVVVVLAAGVAAALILSNLGPTSSQSEISTIDLMTAPKEAWSIDHPLASVAPEDAYLLAGGVTVGQDRALVQWVCCGDETTETHESRLSLIDTKTGETKWEVPWKYRLGLGFLVSLPGSYNPIFSTGEGIASLDLASGTVISSTADLTVIGSTPELKGDVLAESKSTDKVGRYSSADLTKPLWSIENPSGSFHYLRGNRLIIGSDVYSTIDGSKASWSTDSDSEYGSIGGHLLRFTDLALTGVDEVTGADTWTYGMRGKELSPVLDPSLALIVDREAGTVSVLNPKDGTLVWTADIKVTAEYPSVIELKEAGVIWIVASDETGQVTALDASSGEKLYDYQITNNADNMSTLIGYSKSNAYFTESLGGEMSAVDIRTGDLRWAMNGPDDNRELYFWGGNLIAVLNNGGPTSSDRFVLGLAP